MMPFWGAVFTFEAKNSPDSFSFSFFMIF